MLRLQTTLPDRYTAASVEELRGYVAAAKERLGRRLVILGHHYQRDEVMDFADATANNLVGRFIESAEVADVITFLASPKSVAITGDAIAAGGGVARVIYY